MKIVILGSCRVGKYDITAVPEKVEKDGKSLWNTEEGYKIAFEKFKTAIDDADEVWIYCDAVGEHTLRDITYARSKNKKIKLIQEERHIALDQEGGVLRD